MNFSISLRRSNHEIAEAISQQIGIMNIAINREASLGEQDFANFITFQLYTCAKFFAVGVKWHQSRRAQY